MTTTQKDPLHDAFRRCNAESLFQQVATKRKWWQFESERNVIYFFVSILLTVASAIARFWFDLTKPALVCMVLFFIIFVRCIWKTRVTLKIDDDTPMCNIWNALLAIICYLLRTL